VVSENPVFTSELIAEAAEPENGKEQPTILIVDDEAAICDVIEKFLQNFGYEVITTTDPKLALQYLTQFKIDIVLSDLQMGDLSGVDILRGAQKNQPEALVILVTGYPTVENAVQVLKEGAYDYITKPFRLDELGKVVQRALEKQKLSREVVTLRETVALYKISEAMNSSLELSQVLQMILNSAVNEGSCENGCIVLADVKDEGLSIGAARGTLPQSFENIERIGSADVQKWLRVHERLQTPTMSSDISVTLEKHLFDEMPGIPMELVISDPARSVCIPLWAKDRVIGVLYLNRSNPTGVFDERTMKGLSILASSAARAIENARLYNNLYHDYLSIIKSLANAVEAKDPYTRGHSDRVVRYTQTLGAAFHLPVPDLEKLEVASILHDIGKIGIADQILLKPAGLTDEEYVQMKQHPIIGDRILQPISSLKEVRRWVYQHHERHDGLGYPEGIQGDEIDLQARILIVAEVFDALITERAYKKAWPLPTVVQFLKDNSGSHFDPEVSRIFCEILEDQGDTFTEMSNENTYRILSPDDLVNFFKDQQ
jgi:response regulator RpfG family c-di-GMP phosphodiesterase